MLVDNRTNTAASPSNNPSELEEYLNTELFGLSPSPLTSPLSPLSSSTMSPPSPPALAGGSGSGSDSTSSRASSPSDSLSQILSTPPQQQLENAFPVSESDPYSFLSSGGFGGFGLGFGSSAGAAPSFFNFLDEENQNQNQMKVDASSSSSGLSIDADGFDFMSAFGSLATGLGSLSSMAIDPQLVDSQPTQTQRLPPVEEEKEEESNKAEESETSLTITPVKVGGYGKAGRKGTVQSGGITKKVASAAPTTAPVPTPFTATPASASRNKENLSASAPVAYTSASSPSVDGNKDDDDDLPADWRPPPEVFAKMSSKEKRQLRNKISARNFRVRRKEYISTLEMDIAERDRLLQAIRSELGSTQSENLALRQEVAALKKALLDGRSTSPVDASPALNIRGADINLNAAALGLGAGISLDDLNLNLPPPAPLPEKSAAEELALRAAAATTNATASTSTSGLLIPNPHKDLPNSPRINNGNSFWGGVPMGGGFTPVHTVLMPDLNTNLTAANGVNMTIGQWVRDVLAANAANAEMDVDEGDRSPRALQENMNPVMNTNTADTSFHAQAGFDGFADMNPFTMKTLDAYRMQLWAKMAASSHQQQPTSPQQPFQHQSPSSSSSSPSSSTSSSTYLQQRKALERELTSSSPFTLPGPHQKPSKASKQQGLVSSLKPAYFVNSNKANLPASSTSSQPPRMGNTLSALLAGKHSGAGVFGSYARGTQNASNAPFQSSSSLSPKYQVQQQHQQQQQQQQMQAMYAAALATTASQTLLGKLGSAFWDAFSGHPSSSTSTHPSSSATLHPGASTSTGAGSGTLRPWDADKVRRVLEGKAVVRIVDVDETVVKREAPASSTLSISSAAPTIKRETTPTPPVMTTGGSCGASECMTALLEESMKSLTLGKRSK
ncbi:hypothetical protein BDP27DRAFT_1330577 [Rhodocollybia butyracea]|uniref:BZIP domain-containing protein n=1 Tax=Rhodocollybia butyracea TaxID=206335 RepID=A0A9P5PJ65_9AGAR|nr:hypothetical protein BDP27DRAFT_1330577 [Rhodocollybia butyracea]